MLDLVCVIFDMCFVLVCVGFVLCWIWSVLDLVCVGFGLCWIWSVLCFAETFIAAGTFVNVYLIILLSK